MNNLNDQEFETACRRHLNGGDDSRATNTPLVTKPDGTIDREKTLTLECYAGIQF